MKKLINTLKKNKKTVIITLISLIALLVGSFTIGFVKTFLIILLLDAIYFVVSKPKGKKKQGKDVVKTILIVGFTCVIFFLIAGVSFGIYIISSSPSFDPNKLINKEASILYYKDGSEITKLGTEIRQVISYDQLSQSLIDAVIATEDSRYFQHSGVDLPRFFKASVNQLLGKGGG
ncbi:MAG: transglycosylase domain-containing protein, partial [Bacilli bacterium]